MYELVAATPAERKTWTDNIQQAVERLDSDGNDHGGHGDGADKKDAILRATPSEVPRPRSVRVEGAIRVVSAEEDTASRLLDYREHVTVSQSTVAESTRVLSPFERLKRLEREVPRASDVCTFD